MNDLIPQKAKTDYNALPSKFNRTDFFCFKFMLNKLKKLIKLYLSEIKLTFYE